MLKLLRIPTGVDEDMFEAAPPSACTQSMLAFDRRVLMPLLVNTEASSAAYAATRESPAEDDTCECPARRAAVRGPLSSKPVSRRTRQSARWSWRAPNSLRSATIEPPWGTTSASLTVSHRDPRAPPAPQPPTPHTHPHPWAPCGWSPHVCGCVLAVARAL